MKESSPVIKMVPGASFKFILIAIDFDKSMSSYGTCPKTTSKTADHHSNVIIAFKDFQPVGR